MRERPTSLYRLYDAAELLYVGISFAAGRRFAEHSGSKSWWPSVSRIDVDHFSTRYEALMREHFLILIERPPYNGNDGHCLPGCVHLSVADGERYESACVSNRPDEAQAITHMAARRMSWARGWSDEDLHSQLTEYIHQIIADPSVRQPPVSDFLSCFALFDNGGDDVSAEPFVDDGVYPALDVAGE